MDIISDIVKNVHFTKEQYKEMLHGAYIIIHDKGKHYHKWKRKKHSNERISSHYSKHTQYESKLNPKIVCSAVVLFGTTEDNHTWYQLEKTSKDCVMKHTIDYIDYIVSGKNIGVYGKSHYTEKKPLKLKLL